MRKIYTSFADAFTNLRRAPSMAILIIIASAVSLSLLGVGALINSQVTLMKGYWYDKVEVSIFLLEDVTEADKELLMADLEADPLVDEVFYESQAQAYELFREQFKSSPTLIDGVTADQLPESFRVKLTDAEQFSAIKEAYSFYSGVDVVQDQKQVLESFFKILQGVQTVALVLALVQVGTALILIANAVRTAAISRKKEIKIMRLVGAPRFMIAAPFVLEGAIAGFFGGLLSSATLVGLKIYLIDGKFSTTTQSFPLIGWDAIISAIILTMVIGMVLTTLTSIASISRRLK